MPEQIAVIGAGVMGSGIAQVLAVAGHTVTCQDVSVEALDAARANVDTGRFGMQGAVERGKITAEAKSDALARIAFTTDLDAAIVGASVILEAIPEQLDLKIAFWRGMDAKADPETIFASNSSGFPIQAMAAATTRPDRVVGWHWASPAPVMKMAEIIRGPQTSDATVEKVVALAAGAGKNPVVVKDSAMHWGYVANRIYFAMADEAQRVVREGIATKEEVDQLMIDCYRWPSGPFGMTKGAGSGWS